MLLARCWSSASRRVCAARPFSPSRSALLTCSLTPTGFESHGSTRLGVLAGVVGGGGNAVRGQVARHVVRLRLERRVRQHAPGGRKGAAGAQQCQERRFGGPALCACMMWPRTVCLTLTLPASTHLRLSAVAIRRCSRASLKVGRLIRHCPWQSEALWCLSLQERLVFM